jgi:hypothetical protein
MNIGEYAHQQFRKTGFDTTFADFWAWGLYRMVLQTGGRWRYTASHASGPTSRLRRARRFTSGYSPRLSGTGQCYDRLSHRLGRP